MKNSIIVKIPVEVITGKEASERFRKVFIFKYCIVCCNFIIDLGNKLNDFSSEYHPYIKEAIEELEKENA